jgi:hypothetical protein
MVNVETLSVPFATWQEGLLALAGALQDPGQERSSSPDLRPRSPRLDLAQGKSAPWLCSFLRWPGSNPHPSTNHIRRRPDLAQ